MTLNEFISQVLQENNIEGNVEEIADQIEKIARERAVDHVAAISDEEVREMVINNAELSIKLAEEKTKKEERNKEEARKIQEEREKAKKEARLQKKLEKERKLANGEQQTLF